MLIKLINGSLVDSGAIIAIRRGDRVPKEKFFGAEDIPDRIILDFGVENQMNSTVLNFDSPEERDAEIARLEATLNTLEKIHHQP